MGLPLAFQDLELGGIVSDDRAVLRSVSLQTHLDFRSADDTVMGLLGTTDPTEACDWMASFGLSCESCPDGERACLPVLLTGFEATEVSSSIERVDEGC